MNLTFAICLIIFFSFIGEIFTWIGRKDRPFVFGFISITRMSVIGLSICSIYCINKQYDDYEFLNEANSFKYELL